ncbi:hypothetical protein BD770DRAFT_381502 [Pilaira anomala]|nr:hypothetical protein BD770DRAFT_381502 [Pilaira anomala]
MFVHQGKLLAILRPCLYSFVIFTVQMALPITCGTFNDWWVSISFQVPFFLTRVWFIRS